MGLPSILHEKKDGSLRLCMDFRALNKVTKKDCYPLPLISDLLITPAPARIYSKIDLKPAYHLVCIAEGDKPKMAFRTRYGSYEWSVMPFGLSNAPASFQRFINEVLGELMDVCTVGYLDDILIYLGSLEKHQQHVWGVLQCLQKVGLYTNPKKCKFHTDMVEYLGFILSPSELLMDPSKVTTIMEWLEPQKVKDVQAFLGFANLNFYPQICRDDPTLTKMCKKKKKTPC